ncbi:MAG: hypothetical protein GX800_10045, partial [Clostridiaceae bacterium]|nr:hypothetical protein [Clostridiaceae bacterium]
MTIAQQRGITTGVKGTSGVAINRGQVAQMAFNALDVPLMTQTGFGTYIEYVINDGSGTTDRKTLLSENLDIVKLKATVIESYDLSSANKQNQVKIEVVNAYDSIYEDDEFAKGNMVTIDAGVTNIKSLVGYNVILYVSYDNSYDDDPIALYVRKDLAGTDEITIAASDIESVTNVSGDYYEIQY